MGRQKYPHSSDVFRARNMTLNLNVLLDLDSAILIYSETPNYWISPRNLITTLMCAKILVYSICRMPLCELIPSIYLMIAFYPLSSNKFSKFLY